MNNSYNKYRLPKAAYGDYLSKSTENKDATWAAKIRAGLGPEYANYNDEQIRGLYNKSPNKLMTKFGEDSYVAPELDEFTVTSETDKERRDAYLARAGKYFKDPNDFQTENKEWIKNWVEARNATGNFENQLGNGQMERGFKSLDEVKKIPREEMAKIHDEASFWQMAPPAGMYFPGNQKYFVEPTLLQKLQGHSPKYTDVHEQGHVFDIGTSGLTGTDMEEIPETNIHKAIKNIPTKGGYETEEYLPAAEIYAELIKFRKKNKINPNKVFTEDDLPELRKKLKEENEYGLFKLDDIYGDKEILRLMNEVATINTPQENNLLNEGQLPTAQNGGEISTNNNTMLKKANYGMNIPQSTQGQFPAPPVGALNNPAYAQAYTKYMTDNPTTVGQPNQFAPRSEFMYNYGGPTVPYTKETSTAFSGNRGQGPLQAGFNNATPGEYPAISFARNRSTQNVDPRQWANLVVGDLNKPMGVTDTIESMSKNTGATSKRVPMDIYFKNGGKLPKAEKGMNLSGITDFLGSEQGGQLMNTVGQLAPIVQGMMNKPQQGQRPMQTPQQGMMNPYGMPYTNNPYLPQPQKHQAPTYGGFTYGGLNGKEAEALGMPNYGRQFAYGGMLPKHGFGDFLTSAADAVTETMGSGMKIMDPLNIGYGTALSRGMGNLVGEDRYQKGWDQFTDGTQAFVGGAAKGAAGVLPGQMGSLATKGMDAVSGIADNALNNNEYGQLYEGQDKLKQIAGGAGQIGGAVGGGILTGNVAGAVGSGMQGAGNVMQGIDMNNAGEQTGGGWQTAGNITNAASGLASFLPTGAYGGKLPSYGFGNQIGLPGYMGDKDREITINAMNRATPIQSMYNQTPQYQHGMGQSMKGFGPGNQMAYGEMFAKGGVLPSYHNGGEGPGHPHDTETVYSMMNNSEKLKGKPSYWGSRGSFSNNAEGITTMQNDLQQMDISREDYLALEQAKKDLEIEQATLRDYYGQQNYSQTEGIPVDKVNELSPTYYDKMTAYQNMLKNSAGIENTNLAGNIEGNQIPYHDQAFGFRHNSYRPGLHAAENYTQSNANVEEYADINVDKGQQVYTMDGREKVYDNQNQLLRNEEIPTNRGLKSEAMMFYGNTGPIGVHMDEQGRKYLQGEDGSNLGYFGEDFARGGYTNRYTNRYANGGAMQGQHPQAQYEVEKDEMMYHPNDKPVSLANGGLNQVANNYSKVTGNKHSHPNGGPQMAGGEGGYVYSDQLKVPKDLYNSLKGLI